MTSNLVSKVVLVGHCGPDEWMLRSAISRALPDIDIVAVHDEDQLKTYLSAGNLLLMNRALDGDFSVSLAVDLLPDTIASGARVMVISNFEDVQQAALSVGACRGFGKSDVNATATADLLKAAVQN